MEKESLIYKNVSIEIDNLDSFKSGTILTELLDIKDGITKKFVIIKSNYNDDLLVMEFSLENDGINPILLEDINRLFDLFKLVIHGINNEVKDKLSVSINNFFANKEDILELKGEHLLNIGGVYFITSLNSQTNSGHMLEIEFEEEVKLLPEELVLVHQNDGNYGYLKLGEIDDHIRYQIRLFKEFKINLINVTETTLIATGIFSKYTKENYYDYEITNSFLELRNIINPSLRTNMRTPEEVIDFVVSAASMNVRFENYKSHKRAFLCIIPIINLNINENFGIGNVDFITKSDLITDNVTFEDLFTTTFNYSFFAKVVVEGNSFWNAVNSARNQIGKAIDAIYHLTRHDALYYGNGVENDSWEREGYTPKVRIKNEIFVQDILSNEYIYTSLDVLKTPEKLFINIEIEDLLEKLEWYENLLMMDMEEESENNVKTLFIVLRFLRKSWDANNLEDKLIFTSIAFEFLLEDEKPEEYLGRPLRRKFVKGAMAYFETIYSEEDLVAKKQKVNQSISYALSSPSLMDKLRFLVKRLNIPILSSELTCIEQIRNQRNELVHGRSLPDLELELIERANTIIGNMLYYKLKERAGK
ncbi:hypothetical protein [Domibacillus tundrae]|uniref:hypothetical protein n=1 Tax=Domibacillus tundrae TaxID=1587527 RepID=UPI000617D4EA|nr:hypothetical protein [Domibacillus tundrae]